MGDEQQPPGPPPPTLDSGSGSAPEVSRYADTAAPAAPVGAVGPSGAGAPELPALEPGQHLGPYLIAGELGRGGMAVVYRARREDLGREFALKVIRPDRATSFEALERFRREAQVAASLVGHPGIVGVHDIGEAAGVLYLAMDLVEGRTLHELLEDALSPMQAAALVEAAARAVHYAHTAGVLHRDIKPANILVTPEGTARLADFGIARMQSIGADQTQLTRAGSVIGSPDYMSPEQATGAPIDARADVYSLGATLFECLVGQPPFSADSLQALVKSVCEDEVVPPRRRNPSVPRALDIIAVKCLQKRPELRYPTAEALADDLARYRRGEAIAARRLSLVEQARRRVRRNPVATAVSVLGLLALAVAALVVAWQGLAERSRRWATYERAVALTPDAPETALGLLEALRRQAPDHPGLDRAVAGARRARDARAVAAREAEAALLIAKGDAARARFDAAPPTERDAAWYQALGFYSAAREVLAAHTDRPGYTQAGSRVADFAWARLQAAEIAGDAVAAAQFETLIRANAPERFARELAGDGTLTLATDPPGASVVCYRYVDHDGVMEAESPVELGSTPLTRMPLARGSYLLVLSKPGFADVRYPVLIERLEDDASAEPIRLLTAVQVGEGWVYVAAGESMLGGDPDLPESGALRRTHVPGFCITRCEVTVADYRKFLDALLARGAEPLEVQRRCPRQSPDSGFFWNVVDGRIEVSARLPATWPIVGIAWDDAVDYAAWRSRAEGQRVRLPRADEWERAARGADGRPYPWGAAFAADRVLGMDHPMHAGHVQPKPVGVVETDLSPFGVRDLSGSVAEWCADQAGGDRRVRRGGDWGAGSPHEFRCTGYAAAPMSVPSTAVGFRLVRDLPR